jgi:hypothetical protein
VCGQVPDEPVEHRGMVLDRPRRKRSDVDAGGVGLLRKVIGIGSGGQT